MTACLHLSNRSSLDLSKPIIREASAAKRDLFHGCSDCFAVRSVVQSVLWLLKWLLSYRLLRNDVQL